MLFYRLIAISILSRKLIHLKQRDRDKVNKAEILFAYQERKLTRLRWHLPRSSSHNIDIDQHLAY